MPLRLSLTTRYLLGLSAYSIGLLWLVSDMPVYFIWNLALAWVPYALTTQFTRVKKSWAILILFLVWLLFLPNAYYIITDFIHINTVGEFGSYTYHAGTISLETWRLVMITASFAVTGWVLGQFSLRRVHRQLESWVGHSKAWILVGLLTVIISFGIYLGRFARFNSWDLFDPRNWFSIGRFSVGPPETLPSPLIFILVFASFILVTYLPFVYLDRQRTLSK